MLLKLRDVLICSTGERKTVHRISGHEHRGPDQTMQPQEETAGDVRITGTEARRTCGTCT